MNYYYENDYIVWKNFFFVFRFFRNPSTIAFSGFFGGAKTCPLNAVFPLNAVSLNAVWTVFIIRSTSHKFFLMKKFHAVLTCCEHFKYGGFRFYQATARLKARKYRSLKNKSFLVAHQMARGTCWKNGNMASLIDRSRW